MSGDFSGMHDTPDDSHASSTRATRHYLTPGLCCLAIRLPARPLGRHSLLEIKIRVDFDCFAIMNAAISILPLPRKLSAVVSLDDDTSGLHRNSELFSRRRHDYHGRRIRLVGSLRFHEPPVHAPISPADEERAQHSYSLEVLV